MIQDLVCIGKIVSVHGLKGEVKVIPYTDFPDRIFDLERVRTFNDGEITFLNIDYVRFHGKYWLIKFNNMENREEAASLKSRDIFISVDERFELPPNSYYHDDLRGLKVYSRIEEFLGEIKEIISGGGQEHFSVEHSERKVPLLIPFVKDIVLNVDLNAGRMTVDLPDGLTDL